MVFMKGRAVFVAEPARAFPEGCPRPQSWTETVCCLLSTGSVLGDWFVKFLELGRGGGGDGGPRGKMHSWDLVSTRWGGPCLVRWEALREILNREYKSGWGGGGRRSGEERDLRSSCGEKGTIGTFILQMTAKQSHAPPTRHTALASVQSSRS